MTIETFRNVEPFFVQESERDVWHVETPGNPERMLCGKRISVNAPTAKIQRRWGTKPCLWCSKELNEQTSDAYLP